MTLLLLLTPADVKVARQDMGALLAAFGEKRDAELRAFLNQHQRREDAAEDDQHETVACLVRLLPDNPDPAPGEEPAS